MAILLFMCAITLHEIKVCVKGRKNGLKYLIESTSASRCTRVTRITGHQWISPQEYIRLVEVGVVVRAAKLSRRRSEGNAGLDGVRYTQEGEQ